MLIQRTFLFLCILFPLTSKAAYQNVGTRQQSSLARSTRVSFCTCCALILLRLCKKKIDLASAISQGNLRAIKLFVFMGGNINHHINNVPPLVYATQDGHITETKQREIIQYLLAQRAIVEAVDLEGTSALITAAKAGNYWALTTLLNAGASVDHRDLLGNTALLWAVKKAHANWFVDGKKKYLACIELLIQNDASTGMLFNCTESAKSYAIASRDWDVIKALGLEDDPDVIKALENDPL